MKVTVITPTAPKRAMMLKRCIEQFLAQDYPAKQMVIIGEPGDCIAWEFREFNRSIRWLDCEPGLTIGAKRNAGCEVAKGDFIIHMDDDDLYARDWISRSVDALIENNAQVTGLSSAYFYRDIPYLPFEQRLLEWDYYASIPRPSMPYVCEATMCYTRRSWEENKFPDTSHGEGKAFMLQKKVVRHGYKEGFAGIIHSSNTCSHQAVSIMKALPMSSAPKLIRRFFHLSLRG